MTLRPSLISANAQANAVAALANNGIIKIYSGAQPATPETAVSGTLLATLTLGSTAFGASSGGVITATTIATVTIATSGVAGWFRVYESDGATVIYDGAVGTSGAEMNLNSTSLSSGAALQISTLTYTVPGV